MGLLAERLRHNIEYTIVSEAGASVYSASKIANEEFPDLDLTFRSAISIARRVLDPLFRTGENRTKVDRCWDVSA